MHHQPNIYRTYTNITRLFDLPGLSLYSIISLESNLFTCLLKISPSVIIKASSNMHEDVHFGYLKRMYTNLYYRSCVFFKYIYYVIDVLYFVIIIIIMFLLLCCYMDDITSAARYSPTHIN